ncbi:MAG: HAMP domain-containing protein [Oscillospiraceae bacterium]|nr:HAMP domain-containing protein [Oscillospiraceae bacterium]
MVKSIYIKLVAIILVLIVALLLVVGAFLMSGVRNFYVSAFYDQMREVFASADVAADLRAAAEGEGGAALLADILRANMGRLGVDATTRSFFVLDGETGQCLAGSNMAEGEHLTVTRNILTALAGGDGYASDPDEDFMDMALPLRGAGGSYILYVIDNKETVTRLNAELMGIVVRAIAVGLLISSLLGMLLAKTVVTPIQHLTRAAEKVAAGDFSEKVENETADEIGVLARTFNDMADQLETNIESLKNAERTRREFVANVSHELRTPVTSIRSYAETLGDAAGTLDGETERRFLEVIVSESDRLSKIVQDLLLLSRFDAGNLRFDYQQFSFEKSVRSVFDAQLLEAQRRGHDFRLEVRDDLPDIRGDRSRIEQVLINMVSNAIKYTPDGGCIRMTAGAAGDRVFCTVTDNGVGIPQEDQSRVFERFYRVDKARSRESGGTGLGLSIAYEIVERHDGRLELQSQPGKGTAITVWLPVGGPQHG